MTQSSTPALRRFGAFFLFSLLSFSTLFAQLSKHGNVWHFGYRSGLDFSSGSPVDLHNVEVDSYEGCAVWCDENGNLQLYTNGGGATSAILETGPHNGYIWNKNQQVMYDMGDDQGGGYSAAQSALVIPKPGSPDILYVFTMDHAPNSGPDNRGLSYFVVDMTLNGGLGAVIEPNKKLFSPAVEGLTAVLHENGQDFWLVCLDLATDEFVIFPFTAAGVGAANSYSNTGFGNAGNLIKAAPDGSRICLGGSVYRFDRATGQPTFQVSLGINEYSFSFSPSGRYLYGSDVLWENIIRYDMYVAPGDIPKSADTVAVLVDLPIPGLMQLAPDGNIYYTEQGLEDFADPLFPKVSLSRISCPDGQPTLTSRIFQFDTDFNNAGGYFTSLPNFTDYIFQQKPASDTLKVPLCSVLNGVLLQPSNIGISYLWSTGDTLSEITVHQEGLYTCHVLQDCAFKTTVFQVEDQSGVLSLSVPGGIADTCNAFPLTLVASGINSGTYLWSNGSTSNNTSINAFGTYSVSLTNGCGTSTASYTLNAPGVSVSVAPETAILDTCNAFPLTLVALGSLDGTYSWSTGSTVNSTTVNAFGIFSVTLTTGCGAATASYGLPVPQVKVEIQLENPIKDSCNAFDLVLRAVSNQSGTYLWSDGTTTNSFTAKDYGTYAVTLTSSCGIAVDSLVFKTPTGACCKPQFPNVFTPDGDNVNDGFAAYLKGCEVEYVQTNVYSRWGELMFQGVENSDVWNGETLNGTPAPCDVYVYTCRYKLKGDREEQFVKGDITLLR